MNKVRIGMIGSGYIGRCHAIAYAQAPTVFALKGEIVREMLAEVNPELAAIKTEMITCEIDGSTMVRVKTDKSCGSSD